MRLLALSCLSILLLIYACEKDDDGNYTAAAPVEKPESCKLYEEISLYGPSDTQLVRFSYEAGRLIKKEIIINNQLSYDNRFVYDSKGQPKYMVRYDKFNFPTDTLTSYQFKDGLLSVITYFSSQDGKVTHKESYEYDRRGFLRSVFTESGGETYEIMVTTDGVGNPLTLKLIRQNGKVPEESIHVTYEYDDNPNPYYHLPGFTEYNYFAPNNMIKTTIYMDGKEDDTFTFFHYYDEKGLLRKTLDEDGNPINGNAAFYTYTCD